MHVSHALHPPLLSDIWRNADEPQIMPLFAYPVTTHALSCVIGEFRGGDSPTGARSQVNIIADIPSLQPLSALDRGPNEYASVDTV